MWLLALGVPLRSGWVILRLLSLGQSSLWRGHLDSTENSVLGGLGESEYVVLVLPLEGSGAVASGPFHMPHWDVVLWISESGQLLKLCCPSVCQVTLSMSSH